MPKRIDIGTDIATIGVWDPTRERHDLSGAKYADFQAALESEAKAARLFFVETGGDGGHLTDVYVDEQPSSDCLSLYSPVEREFLIESPSGRLIAGGIEDFVSSEKQITSEEDVIAVAPGIYALKIHQLVEDKLNDRVRECVGAEDYAYFVHKTTPSYWGFLLFGIALISLLARLWLISIAMLALWIVYMVIRSRSRKADKRFRDINNRVEALDKQFPPFIYVLRRLASPADITGGWHRLEW
ncbi:hypothetical protein [Lacipirellula parvula]|uniref:Uncharacterized protein n=1 Tax=Lacipirellula parvula TaxID=2650471 RepID=A0A5K7XFK7_9BACT|nr:hypothetical protein [Lacipirellula parvula]BBO31759.1 hypothetical protein PLANPX_1371 [Lacipirellula parvula]